ncbi:MAG: S-disulfanyl-L-cysteine oxidoreductase SoxD [Betaproteobacteria bacterium]|jgi:cytochrome c
MFTHELSLSTVVLALALGLSPAYAAGPNLGQPVNAADIAAWDSSIMPDGSGLPVGSGTSLQGALIYAGKCAACHGENGKGGISSALLRGGPITSINGAEKTIGNFWPYATTLFDYIRRAMPWQEPRSLTSDEVYALTAYVLVLNQLIGENDVMSATTLPKVRMPNRDGFIIRFPNKL